MATPKTAIRFGAIRRAAARMAAKTPASGLLQAFARAVGPVFRRLWRLAWRFGLRRFTAFAKRVTFATARGTWQLLHRHKGYVKSRTAVASDMAAALQESRTAAVAISLALRLYESGVPVLPRVVFAVMRHSLVAIGGAHLAAGQTTRGLVAVRMMNLLFRPQIAAGRNPFALLYFETLHRASLHARMAREARRTPVPEDFYLNRLFGIALLTQNDPLLAREHLERAIRLHPLSYIEHRLLGQTYLSESRYAEAARAFRRSVVILPNTVMAHQNYAGRYDIGNYRPRPWELEEAGALLIYDNLCQLAEEYFLRGEMNVSFGYYQQMLRYQREVAVDKALPRKLLFRLWIEYEQFDADLPVRIFPYEWVTQFGHIGLLDSVVKMRRLGMLPAANYVLLAPAHKVANEAFLSYWEREFCIVRDQDFVDELFPYQRYFGENFMAYPADGTLAEPWTRAAARAQVAWARASRPPLLTLSERDREAGEQTLEYLGIEEDAWYVGLHVREGGFHGEATEGISKHRNARMEDYMPAIREIISRGGYVIRLGDPSMRPLPPMYRVIDYAYSPHRSPRMDLFLLATSRFIIGTTSGLTTAALSFGAPMLLVNCISNDWQLWTDTADFLVKKVYDRREKRYLSFGETYRAPLQGRLINNIVLERNGYLVHPNTPAEILAATRYKLDVIENAEPRAPESDPRIGQYRAALADNPYMFGAARPVPAFIDMNPALVQPPPVDDVSVVAPQWSDRIEEAPEPAAPRRGRRRTLAEDMPEIAKLGAR